MTLNITNASPDDEASLALALTYLNTSTDGAAIMQQAAANNVTITINHVRNDSYDPDTNTIFWDPHAAVTVNAFTTTMGSVDTTTTGVHSAALNLLHEAAHATDPNLAANTDTPDPLYGNAAEKYAAGKENIVGGARTDRVRYQRRSRQRARGIFIEPAPRGRKPQPVVATTCNSFRPVADATVLARITCILRFHSVSDAL